MSAFYCVVLSCVGRGLAVGRFAIHRILPKCLERFRVARVNSVPEQARASCPVVTVATFSHLPRRVSALHSAATVRVHLTLIG
jgi:hypothetical protein